MKKKRKTMPEREPTTTRRITDAVLSIVFVLGIALPVAGFFFKIDTRGVERENRVIAPRPECPQTIEALRQYPRGWEAWFNDRFGFRNSLVRWHGRMRTEALGISTSDQVVIGRDGWLFYAADHIIEDHRGLHPFSEIELRHWQRIIEERHDWLASKGIRYVFVVFPEKSTIYPEMLPRRLQNARGETRLDQLIAHMKAHSHVSVLDVRGALLDAKEQGRIYHKTDTHWNDVGAFAAYREIARVLAEMFPDMTPLAREAFEARVIDNHTAGDLAGMLGMKDFLREDRICLIPRKVLDARPVPPNAFIEERAAAYAWIHERTPRVMETGDPTRPKLVAVHDSFLIQIIPWLSEHFSRSVYLSHTFAAEVVAAEAPDVVVNEIVERVLSQPLPVNPPPVDGFRRSP